MNPRYQDPPPTEPRAGASPQGTWVRLFQPPAEGRLEIGFQGLDAGDHVHVKPVHTDAERGFNDVVRD